MTKKETIVAEWKRLANSKMIQPYDVAAYAIIKALYSKSNDKVGVARGLLLKSFTPITNQIKLDNNDSDPFQSLNVAVYEAHRKSTLVKELDKEQYAGYVDGGVAGRKEKFSDPVFCYILARTDIPKVHQLVQTSHVTMEVGHYLGKKNYKIKNLHFCVLDGGNAKDIQEALKTIKIQALSFFEPDAEKLWGGNQKGEFTSAALLPVRRSVALRKGFLREKKLLEM